MKKEEEWS